MVEFAHCRQPVGSTRQAVVEHLAREIGCTVEFLEALIKRQASDDGAKQQIEEFKRITENLQESDVIWWYRTGSGFDSTAGYALVRGGVVQDAMQVFRS